MSRHFTTYLAILFILLINLKVRSQTIDAQKALSDENIRINKPGEPEFKSTGGNFVDLFTGGASYNISLFELTRGGFSIPVNLSYKTNGIRVMDQASFVGLGWNLNFGGMITKSTNGREDNHSAGYTSPDGYINDEGFGMEPETYGVEEVTKLLDYSNSAGFGDGEADIFSINSFGISGKFILENYESSNPTAKKIDNGRYQVQVYKEEGQMKSIDSIVVNTYRGHTFVFAVSDSVAKRQTKMINIEESKFIDSYNDYGRPSYEWGSYPPATANIWYISRVEFDSGLPPVKFEYDHDTNAFNFTGRNIVYYSHLAIPENLLNSGEDENDNYTMLSDNYMLYNKKPRIRKIQWGNEIIDFIPAPDKREDFNAGDTYSIQYAVLSHKNESGDINEIKRWKLHHSYFKPEANDSFYFNLLDEIATNDLFAASFKRLRLDSLELISDNNVPSYEFSYYDNNCLPYKQSTDMDFWGFYKSSGDPANSTSKPFLYIYPDNNELVDCGNPYSNGDIPFNGRYSIFDREFSNEFETIDGFDRSSNLEDAQTYALKAIKLQEGGHIKYDYELHDFTLEGNTYSGGGIRVSKVSLYNENVNQPDLEYNFSYSKYNAPAQSSGFLYSIPAYAKTDWKSRQHFYYNVDNMTDQEILSRRTIRFNIARNLQSHRGSYVGYDHVSFQNAENNGHTDYFFSSVNDLMQKDEDIFDVFFQGYFYDETAGFNDDNIAYPIKVYEEYEHASPADIIMVNYSPHPFLPQIFLDNIGMTDSILTFDNNDNCQKKQMDMFTRYLNDDKTYGLKSQLYDSYSWTWNAEWGLNDQTLLNVELSTFDMRALAYWYDCATIRKKESSEIQFYDDDEIDKVKRYDYASEWMRNNCSWASDDMIADVSSYIRHEESENSKGQTVHTYTRYSFEFADINNTNHPDSRVNAIIWMNSNKNYKPIETVTTLEKDGKEYVTEAIINTYEIIDDKLFKKEVYKTEIGTSKLLYSEYESAWIDNMATENSFHFDNNCKLQYTIDDYDEYGNDIEQHSINNIHTAIIYAYDNKYPVVVAKNCTYDELKAASDNALNATGFNSFEEITTLSTEQQRTKWKAFNENLRNQLSNSELSTYSYIPLVGMSSEVDWNNKVTYYQYDELQRLETVRDSDYNVLKHVDIEYK